MTQTFKLAATRHATFALLALLIACESSDLTDSPPEPAEVAALRASTSTCTGYSFTRQVNVASGSQLQTALGSARPGDLIRMADGVYRGYFRITASGTSTRPITLCGTRKAVIDGGGATTRGGSILQFHNVSYWIVDGITVRNQMQGIELKGGQRNILRNVECHTFGMECVHIWMHSKYNLVENSWIHDTGLKTAEYGEGIYIGSAQGKWASWTNGPDRSDYNIIRNNRIGPNVRAEHIDGKAGSAYNTIEGNTFDGTGQQACCSSRGAIWVNSWIEITGNDYVVINNRGTRPIRYGYNTQRVDLTSSGAKCKVGTSGCVSYGNRTRYEGNHADLTGAQLSSSAGFGLESGTTGNLIKCSNTVAGGGFARDIYSGRWLSCTS